MFRCLKHAIRRVILRNDIVKPSQLGCEGVLLRSAEFGMVCHGATPLRMGVDKSVVVAQNLCDQFVESIALSYTKGSGLG